MMKELVLILIAEVIRETMPEILKNVKAATRRATRRSVDQPDEIGDQETPNVTASRESRSR